MAEEGKRNKLWIFAGIAVVIAAIGGIYLLVGRGSADKAALTAGQQRARRNEVSKDVPALVRDAQAADAQYAAPAIQALGRVADPNDTQVRQTLEKAITHQNPEVRAAAAQSLGEVASRQPTQQAAPPAPLLRAAVEDGDEKVRGAAMYALGQMSSPDTLDTLLEGLRDPDVQVRRYAWEALQKTMGIRFKPGIYDPETADPNMDHPGIRKIAPQVAAFRDYLKRTRR